MAIGLSSFPLRHITQKRTHTHASTDSSLIIRWHGRRWYNRWRWFAVRGFVRARERACTRACVILTPVTSMTLMAASCPVLTWRPWWEEERRGTVKRQEKMSKSIQQLRVDESALKWTISLYLCCIKSEHFPQWARTKHPVVIMTSRGWPSLIRDKDDT